MTAHRFSEYFADEPKHKVRFPTPLDGLVTQDVLVEKFMCVSLTWCACLHYGAWLDAGMGNQ